jgi:hypothetical protein
MASITGTSGGGSHSGSREESGRETPSEELRPAYSRQGSRGSLSGDMFKRRGSLPVCQSKRGSICAYSGGAMCESTPVGEICEARMAMMKAETITNGVGDNQEVRHLIINIFDYNVLSGLRTGIITITYGILGETIRLFFSSNH